MSFPSSGSGYPQQGGTQQQHQPGPGSGGFPQQRPFPQQAGGSMATLNVGVFLALAMTLLGLVNYFISFGIPLSASPATWSVTFLLLGGLLAAFRVLPKAPKVLPFATLLSVFGALFTIMVAVRAPEVPGIFTVLLILGILQMLVALAALLIDHEIVALPIGGSSTHGQPYGRPGAYPQQGGQGQFPQPTQYGPPVTPANQAGQPAQPPQSAQPSQPSQASAFGQSGQAGQPVQSSEQLTHYASQQGQFFPPQTQQAQESGETGSKSTGQ